MRQLFKSATNERPKKRSSIEHIAIIMDGNGRWAKNKKLPRAIGHRKGLEAVRDVVTGSAKLGIKYLTLFAFSTENWRRPAEEVSFLMDLFLIALRKEVRELHSNNIRLRIIGDRTVFGEVLVSAINEAENLTAENDGLNLTIAANYGGRWDLVRAVNLMTTDIEYQGKKNFSEEDLGKYLSTSFAPEPELFIRTGGEQRISNFLLWQMAYTEFYFTDKLWPDFNEYSLKQAIGSFRKRQRRFGGVGRDVESESIK
ncbi:MAG: di-trans,poly-cis-decaprenylcistransferase [Proteobacteria bacterium]|nr:di-trans,poly-cis-decaprenylcistransferase [Pseudomonadota bacterium]